MNSRSREEILSRFFNENEGKKRYTSEYWEKEDLQLSKERETFEILLDQIVAPQISAASVDADCPNQTSDRASTIKSVDVLFPIWTFITGDVSVLKQHIELAFKEIAEFVSSLKLKMVPLMSNSFKNIGH